MTDEEMIRELTETTARSKSNTKRLDEVEKEQKNQSKLITTVSELAIKQESMNENLVEMKDDIKVIKEKPAKRWDSVIDKISMTILGAIILFLLAKLGI